MTYNSFPFTRMNSSEKAKPKARWNYPFLLAESSNRYMSFQDK